MSKLKFKIVHFLVILVLLLLNVGGCGGQPLSSKFILKVKKQNPLPKEHVQGVPSQNVFFKRDRNVRKTIGT